MMTMKTAIGMFLIALSVAGTLSASCNRNSPVKYDSTGQRCACTNGQYRCCRVRKDFVAMSKGERFRFINTVNIASKTKKYQTFIAIHERNFAHIHGADQFLPWHRWFLLELENILREVDERVTIPYWDWSLYSGRPWGQGRDDVWSSAPWGLGGNGRGSCVHSGPFKGGKFRLTPSAREGCLRRNFNGNPPDVVAIHKCLRWKASEFKLFEVTLRDDIHDNMHCRIGGKGGTMCSRAAANAPEFFLHHGFTDKIWADWQKTGPEYSDAYLKGRSNPYLRGTGYRANDLLDLAHQPRGVCVVYDDPRPPYRTIHAHLSQLTLGELDNIPRHKFTVVGSLEFSVFKVSGSERSTAQKIQKALEPRKELSRKTKLNSQDQTLGFRVEDLRDRVNKKRELGPIERLEQDIAL